MKNDDFWKSQFAKHDVLSSTGSLRMIPASPKPLSNSESVGSKVAFPTEKPSTSGKDRTLRPVRSIQFTQSLEEPAPLVLSGFPAKTKTQWEQWLLNRKAVLIKK